MSDTQDLLPCPFCGELPKLDAGPYDQISCENTNCLVVVSLPPYMNRSDAITAWNTRAVTSENKLAVNPLVWEEDMSQIPEHAVSAHNGFYRYTIVFHFLEMNKMVYRLRGFGDHETLELAKNAARLDNETRLLANIKGLKNYDIS